MTPARDENSTAALRAAVERLLVRVGHWTPERWAVASRTGIDGSAALLGGSGPAGPPSRADLVFGLTQEFADLCADVEGRARLRVPRLENDLALPDQLRVMVTDLIRADADAAVLAAAATRIEAVAAAL